MASLANHSIFFVGEENTVAEYKWQALIVSYETLFLIVATLHYKLSVVAKIANSKDPCERLLDQL